VPCTEVMSSKLDISTKGKYKQIATKLRLIF